MDKQKKGKRKKEDQMENKQRKKRKLNESDQKTSNDTSEDEDFIRKVPHRRGKSTQTQTTKTQSKRPRPTRRKEIASVEGIKGEFLVVRCDEEPGFWLCILTKSASKTDLKNEKKKLEIIWLEAENEHVYCEGNSDIIECSTLLGSVRLMSMGNSEYYLNMTEVNRIRERLQLDKEEFEEESDSKTSKNREEKKKISGTIKEEKEEKEKKKE